MRAFAALSILALAAAGPSLKDKGKCVVDGGEAASDLMDASIFIWGAKQRCGQSGAMVKCEIDISSAVQSIMSMTNTILKVVDRCGDDYDADCGRASTRLVKAIAGLSSANGGIRQKCHKAWTQPVAGGAMVGGNLPGTKWMHGASALCVLDVKNTAKNLLKVVKAFVKIDDKCEDQHSKKCASHALKTVGALAGLGEYLAASIGDCSPASQMAHDAECAQEGIMLAHHLLKVAEAGVEISKSCKPDGGAGGAGGGAGGAGGAGAGGAGAGGAGLDITEVQVARKRLYEEEEEKDEKKNNANIVLGAFLPVTAIVSFVAGRVYANHRGRVEQSREVMSDVE